MADFWIERRRHAFGYRLQPHYEHSYQVLFMLEGKIRFYVGGKSYDVQKGGLTLINTLESHNLEVLKYPYERYVFQIDPSFFQSEIRSPELISLFVKRTPLFSHLFTFPEVVRENLLKIIQEMEKEWKKPRMLSNEMIGADLKRFFVILYRECSSLLPGYAPTHQMIAAYHILDYLDRHYQEEISINSLSAKFLMASHYLSHLFKQETGYSVIDYVITLRMNHAKVLLSETEKSISQISDDCGYSDYSYFSRQFRNHTGFSPKEFRANEQRGRNEPPKI